MARGLVEVASPLRTVTHGEDGVYRVSYQGRMVLWVPKQERKLQARLMCVRTFRIRGNARQCLHCVDPKTSNTMPRPLGDLVHGTEVGEVLHFDHLGLGEGDAIDTGSLVDGGYKHVLVLMDDVIPVRLAGRGRVMFDVGGGALRAEVVCLVWDAQGVHQ